MMTLTLTPEEKTLFEALPDNMREGWSVETENLTYEDDPQKRMVRLSFVRLHDPALLELREKAQTMERPEDIVTLVQDADLSDVADDDIAELFFAIGPSALSLYVRELLHTAGNDKDLEHISSLTLVRHALLVSLQPVSSSR